MIYRYDGSLRGLFTAIFESYRLKTPATDIMPEDRFQQQLFGETLVVETNAVHAERVMAGLKKRSGNAGIIKWLRRALLSEREQVERLINYYVRRQMEVHVDVSKDSADEKIRQLQRLDQQMGREIHRLHAFVRFQRTPDDLYVSLINPDFNCLPLAFDHFVARYPAMDWLIYDTKRHFGVNWSQEAKKAEFITLEAEKDGALRQLSSEMLEASEEGYQDLWKAYFRAVDIPERRNMKLHLQHVPRRYWKYLIEK